MSMAQIKLGNLLWRPHTRPISPEDPVDVKDVNTADIKAKLEQVRQLLSGVATENKLEQARTLLDAISTKDFATQTTLAAVLAKLGQLETEIQAVKANQLSGDQKVQLSGTIVQEVFSRTVRTSNTGTAVITSPSGRVNKGCIIVCTIFGVTGTFQSDEGLRLQVVTQAGTVPFYTGKFTFPRQSIAGQQIVYMFPGASKGDMVDHANRFSMFSGVVPYANRIMLDISGSFNAGEGFDCHVEIIWP